MVVFFYCNVGRGEGWGGFLWLLFCNGRGYEAELKWGCLSCLGTLLGVTFCLGAKSDQKDEGCGVYLKAKPRENHYLIVCKRIYFLPMIFCLADRFVHRGD
jgi:hypothetical protein